MDKIISQKFHITEAACIVNAVLFGFTLNKARKLVPCQMNLCFTISNYYGTTIDHNPLNTNIPGFQCYNSKHGL